MRKNLLTNGVPCDRQLRRNHTSFRSQHPTLSEEPSLSQFVSVNFHFVQKYLFAMPKLKTMIGANRSLAHWLEGRRKDFSGEPVSLGPETDLFQGLKDLEHSLINKNGPDDPVDNLSRGILACAGGHFEGLATDPRDFASKVHESLQAQTPGLHASVTTHAVERGASFQEEDDNIRQKISRRKFEQEATSRAVAGLPFSEMCNFSSLDMAIKQRHGVPIGRRAETFFQHAQKSSEEVAHVDPAAFVEQCVLDKRRKEEVLGLPGDFSEFFHRSEGRKFLAVISIDGNDVGLGLKDFHKKYAERPYDEGAVATEAFFYRLRLLTRVALTRALIETKSLNPIQVRDEETGEEKAVMPLRILMLGGDDILLVLRAYDAIGFLLSFGTWWERLLSANPGGGEISEKQAGFLRSLQERFGAMTFKAGVAMVHHTYPFHAAHQLSEQLADSAKAASTKYNLSCVDWHIHFSSLNEALETMRLREYQTRYSVDGSEEKLVVTKRPYPVFGNGSSLQSQWMQAVDLQGATGEADEGESVARTKLKRMRLLMQNGRREVQLLLDEVRASSDRANKRLPSKVFKKEKDSPGLYTTGLLDVIELMDLANEQKRSEKAKKESAPSGASQ